MAILDWFKKGISYPFSQFYPVGSLASFSKLTYEKFSAEAYITNATAHRCIKLISETAKDIPFVIEPENAVLENLLINPNTQEDHISFLCRFYLYLLLSGNSFVRFAQNSLQLLRPDKVEIRRDSAGYPVRYEYGTERYPISLLEQNEIWHYMTPNPLKNHEGLSPLAPAARQIDVDNAALIHRLAFLQNSARPSGVFTIKGEGTQEQIDAAKAQINSAFTGAHNSGKPFVAGGDVSWQPMGSTARESEFIEGKREAMRGIALAMGVPPMILGIPGDNTYANYREANRAFYRQTIVPLVSGVYSSLGRFFRPTFGDISITPNLSSIHAISLDQEERMNALANARFMTVNEKRRAIGLEDIDGGDRLDDDRRATDNSD